MIPKGETFQIRLGERGRLLVPADIRKRLNWGEGEELFVKVQADNSLRVARVRQMILKTSGLYRTSAGRRSLTDELIKERRAQAKRERKPH